MASSAPTPLRPTDGAESGISSQSAAPARAAVDVIAITTRDDFLLEVGATLGGQASVNPVESVAQALEQLEASKRPQVVMVDSRDVAGLNAGLDVLREQAPLASVVVFASEGAEQELASSLPASSAFAVLPLPLDHDRTSATFGEAVTEARSRRSGTSSVNPAVAASNESATSSTHSVTVETLAPNPVSVEKKLSESGRSARMMMLIGVAIIALVLVGGLIAYSSKNEAPTPDSSTTASPAQPVVETALPAVETSIVKGKVDELLEKARLAMRERRYTEPAGDNALLYYRSAAATDATSAEAMDGLNRVASVLAGRFEESLERNQLDDAATALAQFKNAIPNDTRIAGYQEKLTSAQMSKAIADGNIDRAAALMRNAQQNNLLSAAQIARWRSEISRLQDEARARRAAELAAARDAAAAEQRKARDARLAAAAEAERQAQIARDKEREEQIKAAQAAQTVREAAPTAAPTTRTVSSLQSSLKRKRYVAPEYPPDALAREVGGTVAIEFTVNKDGETRDVHVVSSTPPNVFDRAAIAAVKRWRYEPLLVDGVATEVPVRMNIRFAPPD